MNQGSPDFEAGFLRGLWAAAGLRTDIVMGAAVIGLMAGLVLGWWLL